MKDKTFHNLMKLSVLIIILVLSYRLFGNTYLTNLFTINKEGFQNNNNDSVNGDGSVSGDNKIYGNLYLVTDVSYNNEKTECTLTFEKEIRLDSLLLKLEKDNGVILEPSVILYKDGNNNFEENFIYNNGEINHQSNENDNENLISLLNPLNKFALPIVTNSIKVKLLGESSFTIKKHWVYGMLKDTMSRNSFKGFNGKSMDAQNISSSTDLKEPNHEIYKYDFDKPIKCFAVSFDTIFTSDTVSTSRVNMSVPVEIHYKGLDNGSYKIESTFNTNDFVKKTMLYLPAPILTKTIFIKVPKEHQLEGAVLTLSSINNAKFIGTQNNESFNNSNNRNSNNRNNSNNSNSNSSNNMKNKEKFQGDFDDGYSADDMCPSLSAMEEKLRLTDQICARLEYNDKIKNERIKLERNKQYIMKLKQQDEEIKKLENIIRTLQEKRENRDAYNDALKLAQLEKQKKQAAVIQDLAQDRISHRKSNVVNVDVNLKTKPQF